MYKKYLQIAFVFIAALSIFGIPLQGVAAGEPAPIQPNINADTVNIKIRGDSKFVAQTRAALNLLSTCAPEALAEADENIAEIHEFNRSGMEVDSGVFLASNTTAFAPGYSIKAQVFWYAGTIIHDAHHRYQSQNGVLTDWDALDNNQRETIEADARDIQINVLKQCLPQLTPSTRTQAEYLLKYLEDMQNNITDCDYCRVEWQDRGW